MRSIYANELKNTILSLPRKDPKESHFDPNRYLGTDSKVLLIKTDLVRGAISEFKKQNKNLGYDQFIEVVDSLYQEDIFEIKSAASYLISLYHDHRRALDLNKLEDWLNHLNGWAEIDTLCQSSFPGKEVYARFDEWSELLTRFSTHKNISHRRASMVLLLKTVSSKDDQKVRDLAFSNILKNIYSKDILLTKAISWMLREMIKIYRKDVKEFLEKYEKELPAIAVRETRRKLLTGKKNYAKRT